MALRNNNVHMRLEKYDTKPKIKPDVDYNLAYA